jgi:hypothetical protein
MLVGRFSEALKGWFLLTAAACGEAASERPSVGSASKTETSGSETETSATQTAPSMGSAVTAPDPKRVQLEKDLREALRREQEDEDGVAGRPIVCKPACGLHQRCLDRGEGPKCFSQCSDLSDSPNGGCPAGTYCKSCAERMCPTCRGCYSLCLPGSGR